MIRSTVLLILLAACALPAGAAWAAEVEQVYETEVRVPGANRQAWAAGVREALAAVILKASGDSEAIARTRMEAVYDQAPRLVQQYRYKAPPVAAGQPRDASQILWVRFDAAAVNELLRTNRLPVWGRTRPATLLWLVVDAPGQRVLLSADNRDELRTLVEERAQRRGLPLRLPLLDLTDRTAVQVSDVWGDFQETILQGSKRYQPEAVLVGRLSQARGGTWQARWTLYEGATSERWTTPTDALDTVLAHGLGRSADLLARRYAHVQGGDAADSVLLQVTGVRNLADYNRVIGYLSSLTPVQSVQPDTIAASRATFRLTTRGDRAGLAQALSLGRMLVQEPAAPQTGQPPVQGQVGPPGAWQGPSHAPAQSQVAEAPSVAIPDLVYRLLP